MRSWGVFAIYYFVKKGGKEKENYDFMWLPTNIPRI
jgi:hypothetical protein